MAREGDKVPATSTGIGDIVALTQLLGGQRQTTTRSPGDISALQKVIADAEAADYSKLLESIFAQAQGAVPGIAAGFGRTAGRTYGNAQIQAALGELLKQTTLAGQKQIADQQIQNRQIAANAAQGIAQATTGTTQTTKTKTPLEPAIGGLLLLQALGSVNKQGIGNTFESLGTGMKNIFSSGGGGGGVSAAPAALPGLTMPAYTLPAAAKPMSAAPSGFSMTPSVPLTAPGWAAGDSGLSQFLNAPVSTVTDLITAPISAGINLVGSGVDWIGDQASNLYNTIFGR